MPRSNFILFVALAWIGMIAVLVFSDATSSPVSAMSQDTRSVAALRSAPTRQPDAEPEPPSVPEVKPVPVDPVPQPQPDPVDSSNPDLIVAPYPNYTVTQGPHGYSYGHAAIDLTAGNGAEIVSPINGTVSQLFTDELGNPTLIIDNSHYEVTLMHGDYIVQAGDRLTAGQLVGYESNNGNTVDWWGRSCRGRNCGYHSHLNIFDRQSGSNVNPLLLIPPSQ